MTNPEEVQKAFARFNEWLPRHGALRTPSHDLYLGIYHALEHNELNEQELELLGERINLHFAHSCLTKGYQHFA